MLESARKQFSIQTCQTSKYQPQSNGAVERLVRTMKDMLAAKTACATHGLAEFLQQLRMEYMQRRHSGTGYSASELVQRRPLRTPPPVSPNHLPIIAAAVHVLACPCMGSV